MKFVEFKTKLDPKTALIHAFEYYPGQKLMIMVSDELFSGFRGRKDVRRNFDVEQEKDLSDDYVVYDLYENEDIETCEHYGRATFTHICGMWVMKKFSSKMFHYGGSCDDEVYLIILIK